MDSVEPAERAQARKTLRTRSWWSVALGLVLVLLAIVADGAVRGLFIISGATAIGLGWMLLFLLRAQHSR